MASSYHYQVDVTNILSLRVKTKTLQRIVKAYTSMSKTNVKKERNTTLWQNTIINNFGFNETENTHLYGLPFNQF